MEPISVEVVESNRIESNRNRVETESKPSQNRVETESIDESIRDKWVGATEAYKRSGLTSNGLTKSSFQRAISHLIAVRGCPPDSLRRGDSKNTRYSELAIALIKAYKSGDEELMQQLLLLTERPIPSCSALTVPDHIASLDEKIARLSQSAGASSQAIGDRILNKLSQIALCSQATQERNQTLDSAELLAAENRGIEQALAIFSAEEAAKENALAHLRALKISGNQ